MSRRLRNDRCQDLRLHQPGQHRLPDLPRIDRDLLQDAADPDAFWGNYDFQRAITRGMAEDNIPYGGEYDFIDTYSSWPINHMVAPRKTR